MFSAGQVLIIRSRFLQATKKSGSIFMSGLDPSLSGYTCGLNLVWSNLQCFQCGSRHTCVSCVNTLCKFDFGCDINPVGQTRFKLYFKSRPQCIHAVRYVQAWHSISIVSDVGMFGSGMYVIGISNIFMSCQQYRV